MVSSFPTLLLSGVFPFQTTTVLWHIISTEQLRLSRIWGAVTFRLLSAPENQKLVGQFLLSRGGRATCSRTTHHLQQSRRTISRWGPACMQRWKKWRAITSRKSPEAVPVVFGRILTALYYQLLLHVPNWVRMSVVFVQRYLLGAMTISPRLRLASLLSLWTARGQLDCLCVEKGSNVATCKGEFWSFVQDQHQLECHANRKHYDISNVLSYLPHQSRFRSRRHLYRVSFVCLHVDFSAVANKINTMRVSGLPIENVVPTWSCRGNTRFELKLDRATISHRSIESAICCVQIYVRSLSGISLQTTGFRCCWVL